MLTTFGTIFLACLAGGYLGWITLELLSTRLVRHSIGRVDDCASCEYDRTCLPQGAPCPECGLTPIQAWRTIVPKPGLLGYWRLILPMLHALVLYAAYEIATPLTSTRASAVPFFFGLLVLAGFWIAVKIWIILGWTTRTEAKILKAATYSAWLISAVVFAVFYEDLKGVMPIALFAGFVAIGAAGLGILVATPPILHLAARRAEPLAAEQNRAP